MNKVYLYNGDFEELLVLIISLIPLKLKQINIKSELNFKKDLFSEEVYLNILNKDKKLKYIYKNINKYLIHMIYYVYLSNEYDKENIIYYFILNALIYKNNILFHRNLNCVNKVIQISKYVGGEAHKLKGFVRFKKMKNNFYYGEVKPVNDVLLILANHFKTRLPNECFLIKDVGRDMYAMYDLKDIIILDNDDISKLNIELHDEELFNEELWKAFFKTIGIKERENKKCQKNFMPKRYWHYMLEMEDET